MFFIPHGNFISVLDLIYCKQCNDKSKWKKIHPQFQPLPCQLFFQFAFPAGLCPYACFSRVVTTVTNTSTTQLSAFISNIILVSPIVTWIWESPYLIIKWYFIPWLYHDFLTILSLSDVWVISDFSPWSCFEKQIPSILSPFERFPQINSKVLNKEVKG